MNTQNKIFLNYDKRMKENSCSSADFEKKNGFLRNVFYENYRPFCPPPNGHIDVLEIGCNKGFICNALKEYYTSGNVVGIDLSPNDIAFAKEHFPGIDFFCKNAFDILGNNQFDLIIAKDIMEHIAKDKQEEFVAKLHRALKENGVCIIQVPNMDWIFSNHERYMDFTHEIGYTRESFEDIFRLYFDSNVKVLPSSYVWPHKLKLSKRILFKYIRPIVLWGCKVIYKFIGEGASDVWFYHREIMAVARK